MLKASQLSEAFRIANRAGMVPSISGLVIEGDSPLTAIDENTVVTGCFIVPGGTSEEDALRMIEKG